MSNWNRSFNRNVTFNYNLIKIEIFLTQDLFHLILYVINFKKKVLITKFKQITNYVNLLVHYDYLG